MNIKFIFSFNSIVFVLIFKAEIIFHAAYGSSKDISVYQSIGLKADQIYIVGKVSKKQYSMANVSLFSLISYVLKISIFVNKYWMKAK